MKICTKCKKELPLEAFGIKDKKTGRLRADCKKCKYNSYVRWFESKYPGKYIFNRIGGRKIERTKEEIKQLWRERANLYYKRNSFKSKVRQKAAYHVDLSDSCCSSCGTASLLQRHHPDYSKPLDVVVLCRKCHTAEHLRLKSVNAIM